MYVYKMTCMIQYPCSKHASSPSLPHQAMLVYICFLFIRSALSLTTLILGSGEQSFYDKVSQQFRTRLQFSNKKGTIGKPERPKRHPLWAAHSRTSLSTKYPQAIGRIDKGTIEPPCIKSTYSHHVPRVQVDPTGSLAVFQQNVSNLSVSLGSFADTVIRIIWSS